MSEVEAENGRVVGNLAAETVGQPRESSQLHSEGQVVPLNVTRAHSVEIRVALDRLAADFGYLAGRVRASVAYVAEYLDEHAEIGVREVAADENFVGRPAVGRDLEIRAVARAGQLLNECASLGRIPRAQVPGQRQLARALQADVTVAVPAL